MLSRTGMIRCDPSNGSIEVLTEAEGLLSVAAHDLRLRADRFAIEVDDPQLTVRAQVSASSLRVLAARRGERDLPGELSAAERATIERNLRKDVLHAEQFPEITAGLLDLDYPEADVRNILGANMLRLARQVWRPAAG